MGIDLYLLNRRKAVLMIEDKKVFAGTASRLCKITEMEDYEVSRIAASKTANAAPRTPKPVIVEIVHDMPMALTRQYQVAHLVLKWSPAETTVTDYNWSGMPVLGYAVRDNETKVYTLHEDRDGKLYPVSIARAADMGLSLT